MSEGGGGGGGGGIHNLIWNGMGQDDIIMSSCCYRPMAAHKYKVPGPVIQLTRVEPKEAEVSQC